MIVIDKNKKQAFVKELLLGDIITIESKQQVESIEHSGYAERVKQSVKTVTVRILNPSAIAITLLERHGELSSTKEWDFLRHVTLSTEKKDKFSYMGDCSVLALSQTIVVIITDKPNLVFNFRSDE